MKIPAPTEASGLSAAEIARWKEEQRILEADPRTSGSANRPAQLVRRVLAEARAKSKGVACMCGAVDPPRPVGDDGLERCAFCGCH